MILIGQYFTRTVRSNLRSGVCIGIPNFISPTTGRTTETVNNAQEVGATGTALVVAAGLRGIDVDELARRFVKANHTYIPNPENKEAYERTYQVFKKLYKSNAAHFKALNGGK